MNFDQLKFEKITKALIKTREGVTRAEFGARSIAAIRSDAGWLRAAQVYGLLKEDLDKKLKDASSELAVMALAGKIDR